MLVVRVSKVGQTSLNLIPNRIQEANAVDPVESKSFKLFLTGR